MAEKLIIKGGNKLLGKIKISGSKNSSLPIMAASLLTDNKVTITNLPHLEDISTMFNLLIDLGVDVEFAAHSHKDNNCAKTVVFDSSKANNFIASYDIVTKMRASILILAPLLNRFSKAKVALPGGCAIGSRPVDLHLTALEKLGADIKIEQGFVMAEVKKGYLEGAEIDFPIVSVGATETALMAGVLARGKTILRNVAIEPEIIELIEFLNKLGADISLSGTVITINGVVKLEKKDVLHKIHTDRIQAGSYAVAVLATKGSLEFLEVSMNIFAPIKKELEFCGAKITEQNGNCLISYQETKNKKETLAISTAPYPNFPTDMQAQFATLLLTQNFNSVITETIFENRFMYVPELDRMGANLKTKANKLYIKPQKLTGALVKASDLRASFALIIAGLVAKGETIISDIYHLDRGYEFLEESLSLCGIDIRRVDS